MIIDILMERRMINNGLFVLDYDEPFIENKFKQWNTRRDDRSGFRLGWKISPKVF